MSREARDDGHVGALSEDRWDPSFKSTLQPRRLDVSASTWPPRTAQKQKTHPACKERWSKQIPDRRPVRNPLVDSTAVPASRGRSPGDSLLNREEGKRSPSLAILSQRLGVSDFPTQRRCGLFSEPPRSAGGVSSKAHG
ncbi:unnamed protein product [Lampetra planeri]